MPSRIIATAIALIAFTAALIGGIVALNPTPVIISRALFAMFACYVLGLIVGAVAQRAVQEHIDDHKLANPIDAPIELPNATETIPQSPTGVANQNNPSGQEPPATPTQVPPAVAA